MLKGALRRINTVKPSSYWGGLNKVDGEVLCPNMSIFKNVFFTLNVKIKMLSRSVRVPRKENKRTPVKWALGIIKKVKFYAFFRLS